MARPCSVRRSAGDPPGSSPSSPAPSLPHRRRGRRRLGLRHHHRHRRGCTPGYWKHTSNWQELRPTGLVDRAFPSADLYESPRTTWLQALQGGGGPGAKGPATILLRAATAASLNAVKSGDRQRVLDLAAYFGGLNNADCPLS